jgi:hypothetical protein
LGDPVNRNKFQVHQDHGTYQVFQESSHGLYFMDDRDPLVSTVLINMVAKNRAKYTQHDYSQSVLACKLQKIIGWPRLHDYIHMVRNNLILNCPITTQDILAAKQGDFWTQHWVLEGEEKLGASRPG